MEKYVFVYFESHEAAIKHYNACQNRPDITAQRPEAVKLFKSEAGVISPGNADEPATVDGWRVPIMTWSLD